MKIIRKYKYIILILIITIALLFKLFTNTRFFGHDTIFHLPNIVELSKTISLENIFGSKLITFACNKFGYGTGFFYPKLPHLSAAYLYLIFQNVYTSMNLVYLITTFLSGIAMFFLSKKVFNNQKIALLSAILYLTIPYHVTEIYIRDAFAENFMFLASPLIFLGLYSLKDDDYKQFYITFILGYVIGMYSHLVSMVFCTIIVGLFILHYRKYFFKKEKMKALIISTLIVTGLTLPFLITVIEYKLTNSYTVFLSEIFTSRYALVNRTLEIEALFNQEPLFDKIKAYFNISTIILFIITTIQLFRKKIKYKKELLPMLVAIFLLINFICSKIVWEYIPDIFLMLQFPWRLLVFLSMFVALYSPICLLTKTNIPKILKKVIFCLIICFILIEGLNNIDYYGAKQYTIEETTRNNDAMGYQKEYLPLNTNQILDYRYFYYSYVEKREDGIFCDDENVEIKITEEEFPSLSFEIKNVEGTVTLELPRVYYLGYVLKDEEGNKLKLYNNENGFLGVDIKKSGKYELYHTTTIPEKIANTIGILTIAICVFYVVKRCKNEK